MPLSAGARLGVYEVLSSIGAGGMGEVYRARDTKLNREVAIKVLPDALAADPDRMARLEREAQALAALNHPNIAAVYAVTSARTETGECSAIVMELVEGEDLSQRLARGPLPTDEALSIARGIADALESAHEAGIVHRDLKPANIKVRPDGTAKVLDFGLAKAFAPGEPGFSRPSDGAAEAGPYLQNSPTFAAHATQVGTILGTPAYMAPEQAKGKAVDRRVDVWAFGVVLCEMFTGRRLFDAGDVSDTLAAVLTKDVSLAALPPALPPKVRTLVRDCLVRDPKARLRDIGDARIAVERIIAHGPEDTSASDAAVGRSLVRRVLWPALALIGLAAAIGIATGGRTRPPGAAAVQFSVAPPDGVEFSGTSIHLSPNGRMLGYIGLHEGRRMIWVHAFETAVAQALPSTEGATPDVIAWSPDSQKIAFRADDKLKQVSVDGGPAQTICPLPGAVLTVGVSWGSNDVILLGQAPGPIVRVAASGGQPVPITALDESKQEIRHISPEWLPGERAFIFFSMSTNGVASYVGSVDGAERRPLDGVASTARYSPTGHVLFLREGSMMAQTFDVSALALRGQPFALADGVAAPRAGGRFAVSATGTLAYRVVDDGTSRLHWFDRSGKRLEAVGPTSVIGDIELSPDERYVLYESGLPGDIWTLDLRNEISQRQTSGAGREADPVWSPDGRRIAYRSDNDGGRLYVHSVDSVSPDMALLRSATRDSPAAWSPDGKHLAYESEGEIWALPLDGEAKPMRVTEPVPGANRANSQISPDGRWVAYQSRELGRPEVYVRPFPNLGAATRVSPGGGTVPRWSRDGKELFYIGPASRLMAVPITASGDALNVGTAVALFELGVRPGEAEYAVSSDGRFLVNIPEAGTALQPITVILNWAQRFVK